MIQILSKFCVEFAVVHEGTVGLWSRNSIDRVVQVNVMRTWHSQDMKTILIVCVSESAGQNLNMHRYIAQSQQADATGGTHVLLANPVELVHQMFVLWHCWRLKSDDHEFTGRYTLEDERLEATNDPSLKDFFSEPNIQGIMSQKDPKGESSGVYMSMIFLWIYGWTGVMLGLFQVESDGHPQASRHSRHAEDATAEPTTFLATTASATTTTAVGVPKLTEKLRAQ